MGVSGEVFFRQADGFRATGGAKRVLGARIRLALLQGNTTTQIREVEGVYPVAAVISTQKYEEHFVGTDGHDAAVAQRPIFRCVVACKYSNFTEKCF